MIRERSADVSDGLNNGGTEVLITIDDEDVRVECEGL